MSGLDDLIKSVSGGSSGGGGGLGDILGSILGGGAGTGGTGTGDTGLGGAGLGGMLSALLPMLGSLLAGGGLQKILSGLQANGLSAETDSWIGTGENEPVSGADVRQAIGADEISRIAQQLGVSDDEAAGAVAQVLPVVVDRVSPGGELESDAELATAFDALEHLGR
jgi:uncharacterized protein YidB (DUF937 family)